MKKRIIGTALLITAFQIFGSSEDLASLHKKLIQFYGYQRAGLKTGSANNLNSGWANASHNGDNYNGNPLDGGWYDAGDYVKFGMNLGYTVYSLLKAYDFFPGGYSDEYSFDHSNSPNKIPDILDEVKFATDYLCKAVINDNTIVLDVGDGNDDHKLSITTPANDPEGRSGDHEIKLCTGADIPLTYAACLALMSTLYRKYDAAYADKCLTKAKIAFDFGKKKVDAGGENNWYCKPQGEFYEYEKDEETNQYMNRDISDRMVPAGIELYRATNDGNPVYKEYAEKTTDGYNCAGFELVGPLASIEVWRQGLGGYAGLKKNVGFIFNNIKESGMFKGVFQNNGWGTASDVGTAALEFGFAYVYSSDQTDRENYLNLCKTHVDWVTGNNSKKQSFVCGYNGGPTSIHYRTSRKNPIPGAVVAGPDPSGVWQDDGDKYQFTEVAINYNAGLVGAVGFLRAITNNSGDFVKIPIAFSATPTGTIDFTKGTVKFNAGFSKSVEWTIKINGQIGSKIISKNSSSINETWDGSADQGQFLGGEKVMASVDINGDVSAIDIVKIAGLSLPISNVKSLETNAKDQLIDDFTDKDTLNKIGGSWSNGGNITGLSVTRLSAEDNSNPGTLKIWGSVYTKDNSKWLCGKTTFNKEGTAKDLSGANSIYFRLKGSKEVPVRVELEQVGITAGEYYAFTVPVTLITNTYRIKVSDFKQPAWKKTEKALDLKAISALRFAVYDSVGAIILNLDDVMIGNDANAVSAMNHSNQPFRQTYKDGTLQFSIPQTEKGTLDFIIYNLAGKVALRRSFNTKAVNSITLPLSPLPAGIYTVVSSLNGVCAGENMKIIHTH
jgi:hypothetical protein